MDYSEAFQRARQRELDREHDHGLIREQVRHLKSLEQKKATPCGLCVRSLCICGKVPGWLETESSGV